jgi:NAD-dependent SIR2 family protein deacetylase
VYTSNLDKHFLRSGFPIERVCECHGSLYEFQCIHQCSKDVWDGSDVSFDIDPETLRIRSPLPNDVLIVR